MASARDLAPIILSGLAGAFGGQPAARGITNAAEIVRQGRLDKERAAESAIRLKLAEDQGARAAESHKAYMDRNDLMTARMKKQDEDLAKANANYQAGRAEFEKVYGDKMDDQERFAFDNLITTPRELFQLSDTIEKRLGADVAPSLSTAREIGGKLGPGEQYTTDITGGGRYTARGIEPQQPQSYTLERRDFDIMTRQADRKHDMAVEKKAEQYQAARDRITEFKESGGDTQSSNYLKLQRDAQKAKREYLAEQSPERVWEAREEYYRSKNVPNKVVDQIRDAYFAQFEQQPTATTNPDAAPAVDTDALAAKYKGEVSGQPVAGGVAAAPGQQATYAPGSGPLSSDYDALLGLFEGLGTTARDIWNAPKKLGERLGQP